MKKGLFTVLFTLCFAAIISAQTPDAVVSAFAKTNPGVNNATYVLQGKDWRAQFTEGGKQVAQIFTAEGVYVAKEKVIQKNLVPAPALQDMEARFSGFPFIQTAERTLANGDVVFKYQYQTGNSNVEVFYSANGQMLSRAVF